MEISSKRKLKKYSFPIVKVGSNLEIILLIKSSNDSPLPKGRYTYGIIPDTAKHLFKEKRESLEENTHQCRLSFDFKPKTSGNHTIFLRFSRGPEVIYIGSEGDKDRTSKLLKESEWMDDFRVYSIYEILLIIFAGIAALFSFFSFFFDP